MMQTTCSKCQHELGGYVVKGNILFANDIVTFFNDRVTRETVNDWFHSGELTGWKKRGIRGWYTTVEQFALDLKRTGRKPEGLRADARTARGDRP